MSTITKFLKSAFVLLCCVVFTANTQAQTPMFQFSAGTGGNAIPMGTGTSWDDYRSQFLYFSTNFTPAPPTTALITTIYFRSYSSYSATTYNDFKVNIGNTTTTSLTTTFITGLPSAVNAKTFSLPSTSKDQWIKIELDNPITIDFTQPFVVDVNQTGKVGSAGGYSLYTGSPSTKGNTQTYSKGATSTTGSARAMTYSFGFDIITCSTAVTKQPVGATVCENQNAAFEIDAIDVDKYQWQADEGSGFFDLSDGPIYSGTGTAKLAVSKIPFSFDGVQYRCLISKTSCADTSNAVTLNVNGLVKLEAMPGKDTTCINAITDLEVKGTGSITNYRWQIYNNITSKFEDVPSAPPYLHLGNKLQILGVPDTLDGARYRVVVDGVCDNDISTITQLKVNAIPKVAVPPVDVNTSHGKQVMFEVQATAAGARFQWQVAQPNAANYVNVNDGGIYSGAKTNRLRVNSVTRVQNEYRFRCVVRTGDACVAPGDTSQFAVLYVEPIVGVENVSSEEYMVVYPNPTSGSELYIELKGMATEGLSYQVIDKVGRLVNTGKFNSTGKTTIDVSNLSADMYMIKMIDTEGKQVATSKFTKM